LEKELVEKEAVVTSSRGRSCSDRCVFTRDDGSVCFAPL
jgi:hypothetical protein